MKAVDAVCDHRVLILSGGVGLGAYQGGAYERLHANAGLHPTWVAGSSTGAVTGAVIAGNAPDERISRLQALWRFDPRPTDAPPPPLGLERWRHLETWGSAIAGRLTGAPGHFRPRVP